MDRFGFCCLRGTKGVELGTLLVDIVNLEKVYYFKSLGQFSKKLLPRKDVELYLHLATDHVDDKGATGLKYVEFPFDAEGNYNTNLVQFSVVQEMKNLRKQIEIAELDKAEIMRLTYGKSSNEIRNKLLDDEIAQAKKMKDALSFNPAMMEGNK